MQLRELQSKDVFTMVKLLKQIGFQEVKNIMTLSRIKEISAMMKSDDEKSAEEKQQEIGFEVVTDVVSVLMDNIEKCESTLYKFLSDLSGKTVKEVSELPMMEFFDVIMQVFQKEEFKDFFKVVSGFFGSEEQKQEKQDQN